MPPEPAALLLEDRGVLSIAGEDAVSFLQGLVSNDVAKVTPDHAVYAALLTPQGRYLHDFMIARHDDALLLECDRPRLDDLKRRLGLYKLRAKVMIADASDRFAVAVLWPGAAAARLELAPEPGTARAFAGGIAFVDPRLADLGARAILPLDGAASRLQEAGFATGPLGDYERLRIRLGVPAGAGRDLVIEKSILLENGFDELHGVDWKKGCYIGQELTARTKYRGLVKKRLLPVEITGPLPAPGTAILLDGEEIGEMRGGVADLGLALLRLDAVARASAGALPFVAGDATLTPTRPSWMPNETPNETGEGENR